MTVAMVCSVVTRLACGKTKQEQQRDRCQQPQDIDDVGVAQQLPKQVPKVHSGLLTLVFSLA